MCLPPLSRTAPAQHEAQYAKPPPTYLPMGYSYIHPDAPPMYSPEDVLEVSWLSGVGADFSQMFSPPMSGPPDVPALRFMDAKSSFMTPSTASLSSPSSPLESDDATVPCKKQRKRRLATDLSPSELAKMREVNRIAAQRHRSLAKKKAQEQERRANIIGSANEELRLEIDQVVSELETLKRVVMDLYGPAGLHRGALGFL